MNARIIKTLGAVLLLGGSAAKGDLQIHDNFEYPDGDLAGGAGSGWTTSWAGTNPVVVTPGSLTFSDEIGNTLVTSGSALNTADGTAVTTISSRETGDRDGEAWISVLVQPQNAATDFVGVSFYDNGLTNAEARFAIEHANGKDLRLTRRGGGTINSPSFPTTLGKTVLAVIHLVPDGGGGDPAQDRIDVFFNPPLDAEPVAPHASLNIDGLQFDRVRIAGQNGRACLVDELRVGSSYADVMPYVPAANPDHDGDGLTDAQEEELGLDPYASDARFIAAVRANAALFGLRSPDEIYDVKLRRPVVSVSGTSVEYSFDLIRPDGFVLESVQEPIATPPSSLFLRLHLDTP
ncbi:hypothetical protein [Luteolibacter luteus]|uniref:Uncharacterized protein n=1 Tax=Luteolibacter luteus TaxID=2728835 RepID=A0A858RDE2_9BACT|nr:hypothetical protein [Luteolibacter luteus]QJE94330.1 hypothetical protein HHL09_00525 [Luteolibacter luteus]